MTTLLYLEKVSIQNCIESRYFGASRCEIWDVCQLRRPAMLLPRSHSLQLLTARHGLARLSLMLTHHGRLLDPLLSLLHMA